MVSIEYPSSQWRDPHGPFEEGNVKRVDASLDAIDNDINGTGIITIIQEKVNNDDQGKPVTTDINDTETLTIFNDGSSVPTMRKKMVTD